MRDDLGRNEREALLMTHRNDNDVLLTVWAGVALVTGGCAFVDRRRRCRHPTRQSPRRPLNCD